MSAAVAFRGQPLLLLVGLLGAWLALRVALWQPAVDAAILAAPSLAAAAGVSEADADERFAAATGAAALPVGLSVRQAAGAFWSGRSMERLQRIAPSPLVAANAAVGEPAAPSGLVRMAVGHTLLLAAGLSQIELAPALAAYLRNAAPQQAGVPAAAPLLLAGLQHASLANGSRWSGDAWLMMRQDTTTPVASGRPSYGRSQAGAVLRYRLAPSSGHAPQAYARASSALSGPLERDAVVGLSARPLSQVPLRVALEARVSETAQGTELRPAAIAVTELPAVRLPGGLRGEAYVQGGYVGGRFATAFVDGQGRVERTIARIGETEVATGAGVWGGAQKGAARLDVGPTAAVSFRVGDTRGRVAADYRIRVAGDAEPRSGPALTLSAGF